MFVYVSFNVKYYILSQIFYKINRVTEEITSSLLTWFSAGLWKPVFKNMYVKFVANQILVKAPNLGKWNLTTVPTQMPTYVLS